VAERLLGQCLASDAPAEAARHLEDGARILDEVGARNDFAKALVAQAELARRKGDGSRAHELFERALGIFESLGTVDEPAHVRAALLTL
jgi:hypothetical protein